MKNSPAKHCYSALTPEERFSLFLQAFARSDDTEMDRLSSSAPRMRLDGPDHFPFVFAFVTFSDQVLLDTLETATEYLDTLETATEYLKRCEEASGGAGSNDGLYDTRPLARSLALGFALKAKMESWKLFCERYKVPPFHFWEMSPGFDRLQRALKLAEKLAFGPKGMIRSLNSTRPEGAPEVALPFTPEKISAGLEEAFRTCLRLYNPADQMPMDWRGYNLPPW
jgi:hypothetical protein